MKPRQRNHVYSATAEFTIDLEEAHVEVSHEKVDVEVFDSGLQIVPETGLVFPEALVVVRHLIVEVNNHDGQLMAKVAHLVAQGDLANSRLRIRIGPFLLATLVFFRGEYLPSNVRSQNTRSNRSATFTRTNNKLLFGSLPRRVRYS